MDYKLLIKDVEKVVRKASKICLNSFDIEIKGDISNIVTTADKNIQEFLDKELSNLLPGSSFYQEEQDKNKTSEGYLWIIDPIDGTENFSRSINDFCISAGLAYGGEMVLGVVYIPKTDEMFTAIKGNGAYLNGERIHVSKREFNESLFATALCLYKKEYAQLCSNILNKIYPNIKDFRRFGSCACELCYLACGRIDLFFEIRVFLWDYAASLIILKEAGGKIGSNLVNDLGIKDITAIIASNSEDNFKILKQYVNLEIGEQRYE